MMPSYCAAKAGVIHLSRAMALELAPHKIRVNAIAPGFFESEMTHDYLEQQCRPGHGRRASRMKRTGAIDELDGALLLLASDASSYMTGAVLSRRRRPQPRPVGARPWISRSLPRSKTSASATARSWPSTSCRSKRDRENYDEHENIALPVLEELRGKAKAAGLWAPQMPKARGGQGLPVTGMAACYEEMGRSIFGPVVFNCAAPDDGNMLLLEKVASDGAEDALAAADRRRQGALRLRHDRAHARRRLRSRRHAHARREEGRPLAGPWPQMVHHRRRPRRPFHPDRPHVRRSRARA